MNKLLILILFSSFSLSAMAFGEFKGCGEYYFAGRLVKNANKDLVYLVKERTNSQMSFSIADEERSTLAAYLDKPTAFIATIYKPMDGTKGVIKKITQIQMRMPDPLNPKTDSYIEFKSKKDCEK
ncbi:hypothetical protein ACJVC5_06735 [Peredibacter sp. HCB2-198]|uniref:hypothetical protein n=1 Tax=Peredibacter sp. HCB2-198 TaxID=3383025 RepID=UPI0038B52A1A